MWKYKYINILVVWRKVTKNGDTLGRVLGKWTRINCEYFLLRTYGNSFKYKIDKNNINQYIEILQINKVP